MNPFRLAVVALLLLPVAAPAQPRLDDDGNPLPEGAIARIGSAKSRAGGYSQLSPDGTLIAFGGNKIEIREADTRKSLITFDHAKGDPAHMLAFSTDNKRLAVIDKTGKLSVYDTTTGKLVWASIALKPSDAFAQFHYSRALKFVDGDKHIAVVRSPSKPSLSMGELRPSEQAGSWQVVLFEAAKGEDNTPHVIDDAKKALVKELGEGYAMVHVALSPKGERMTWLASPKKPEDTGKSAVFVYETVSGKLLHTLKDLPQTYRVDLPDEAEHIVWFPVRPEKVGGGVGVPGGVLAVPGGKERFKFDYRFEPSAYVGYWDSELLGHATPVRSAVRVGDSLVTFDGFGASRWDWKTGKHLELRQLAINPSFVNVSTSYDGKRLLIHEGGSVHLSGGELDAPRDRVVFPYSPIVRFLPDGQLRLTSAPEENISYGRRVDVWDPRTRTLVETRRFPGFSGLSGYGYLDADEKLRASQNEETGETYVRDITTAETLCQLEGVKRNGTMHYINREMSHDGSRVLIYSDEPDSMKPTSLLVRWFDSTTGKELGRFEVPARDAAPVGVTTSTRCFAADGSVVGYYTPDQRLVLVDCATRKPVATLGVSRPYRPGAAKYSYAKFTFPRDTDFVLERVETYQHNMIAAKLVAQEYTIWDREGHMLRRFPHPLAFIPWTVTKDGRYSARFTKSKSVDVYETATGKLCDTLTFPAGSEVRWPHPADLEPWTHFSADFKLFATPVNGTVLVWDVDKLRANKSLPAPKTAKEAEALWDKLGDADPAAAEPVVRALIAAPEPALAVMAERLKPAKGAVREFDRPNAAPACLRELRALEVLERIGIADAKKLVEAVAKGHADALLTREAKLVLSRWR
jgi:hypothetical protein